MKATTNTPNTLFLAVWSQNNKCVVLGNFRSETGMEIEIEGIGPVLQVKGDDPFVTLAKVLEDLKRVCANHIIVFTNDHDLAKVFTYPVWLEPRSPDRLHLCVPVQWEILRAFCCYETWQLKFAHKLPRAQAIWEETYGKRN